MDHLLLGTAANKVHDRSLQASATQKWAASTTTEALADVFDDDDALSELRQTPAITQDAASLASKVSDATAARLAHTLDRISPDTAHTAAVPAQTTPRKTDVREDLYARLGGTSPFQGQKEAFPPSPGISKLGEPPTSSQKELPSRLHFAAVGGARTKLVKRRLTLCASRRRDKLRRALGRWQALSAACNARLASIETVEASLQAAEQRREGAVALARALTARVDAATAAALDAARLRTRCAAERRRGHARVVFSLARAAMRRARRAVLLRSWGKWASSVRKHKAWASYKQDGALAQKRADRRSKFWMRRSLRQAWKAWVLLSKQFAEFRRKLKRDQRRAAACASIRKLLQRVRALENRLKPHNDPWAHRDIREAIDEKGRTYWWERLPTAHRHHQDGTPKPIRRWWKDPRLATETEQKTVRRRPVASKEPPLHVPYRLLVLQARADVAPPQKRRRRRRVVRKKALPRVASLGNPKHARHAPLHPHDVDAFLAGAAPRRPLAPNVNVYRVAVPF
jgi:hypothetical protein